MSRIRQPRPPSRRADELTVWSVDGVHTGAVVAAEQQRFGLHQHDYHELFWGTTGPFSVTTERRLWIVAPMIGLFVPAGVLHAGHTSRDVRYHLTEFPADRFAWPARMPQAVIVAPAAQALLCLSPTVPPRSADVEARAARLAFDLLAPIAGAGVELPRPHDSRARTVADALLEDPGDQRTLAEWGRRVGASERTLSRLFADQTGLSFSRWRGNARIASSMVMLASGGSVAAAARAVGYDTASSFTRAFREAVGQPPRAFIAAGPTRLATADVDGRQ